MPKKKKSSKPQQFQNRCVFCNGTSGLTKEHILPNWLSKTYPDNSLQHPHITGNLKGTAYGPKFNETRKYQQGSVLQRKKRIVCGKCNSGWMSVIENNAKTLLVQMFNKECFVFDEESRKIISSWLMLSSIINEYTNTKNQAITKEDREYLMNNKSAPNHFEVYVGYSSDTNKETRVWHSGTSFVLSDKHVPYAGTQKKNSQVTMIHLQNSIFVSRCCYIDNVPFDNSGVIENKFYKIWPLDRIEYKWPINEHLNLADLENVRHQFTSPQIKIVE